MKKKRFKMKGLALAALLFSMSIPWGNVTAAELPVFSWESVEQLPEGDFQFSKKWQINTWAAILPNNSGQFESFEGQGEMYIKVKNIKDFNLYVNDSKIDSSKFETEGLYNVDLSNVTKNGKNTLLLLNVEKDNENSEGGIEINIPYAEVKKDDIKNSEVNEEFFLLLDQLITAETKYGLTGAQLTVLKNGEMVKNNGYGFLNNYKNVYDENNNSILDKNEILPVSERDKVTTDTLFDMASNTKMYATVYALQKLVSEGKVSLSDKISQFFPDFQNDGIGIQAKEEVTVGHLLRHDAGFTPDPQYHNENYLELDFENTGVNPYFSQDRETTLQMTLKTPLQSYPGSKVLYSDVDFILLGFVVEKVTGERLDEYVNKNFYKPLNLTKTVFNPLENGFSAKQITASEIHGNTRDGRIDFKNKRTEIIQGSVHDEKAFYSLAGVSGHAGLFSTSEEIATLAQVMLNKGGYGQKSFFSPKTIDEFVSPSVLNDSYAYGWRRQGDQTYASIFSTFASNQTIGHTGWTGTLTLIDPRDNLILVLNTNSRNSPIMGPGDNTFFTTSFLTNGYGAISSLVYQAFNISNSEKVDNVLKEMIDQKASFVFDGSQQHTSGRNSLRALLEVLERRSAFSDICQEYLSAKKVQAWVDMLKNYEETDFNNLAFTSNVDLSILGNFVKKAKVLEQTAYTPESWKDLQSTLLTAENYLEDGNATQKEIDNMTKKLVEALNRLELADSGQQEEINKEKLATIINQAKKIAANEYTSESYAVLLAALDHAEKIYIDKNSKQEEVEQAEQELLLAIEQLVKVSVDKISLSTNSLEILKKGKTLAVKVTTTPTLSTAPKLTWKVQNEKIASVDENGIVTAKANGTTKITVTAENGKSANFTLRVSN